MTAGTTDVDKRILLVTGKNYNMYAFWVKARLLNKGLWDVVNTGRTPTVEERQVECDALDLLVSSISESILSRVLDTTSVKDV
jgi:hypothetical protein